MLAQWLYDLAHAPLEVLIIALVIAAVGFYTGFASLRRYRLIEDVPTAKVRSAHQGYVELVGRAVMMDGEPIVAPLSQTQCCWYRYSIEERSGKHWDTLERKTSDALFMLRDDTGDCVIDPEGAEVESLHGKTWYGGSYSTGMPGVHVRLDNRARPPSAGTGMFGGISRHIHIGAGRYRFRESVILDGDPLYAIGWFKSLDDSDLAQSRQALSGQILREWKRQPHTLRERFDHDRDGSIDIHEWEDARRVAAAEAQQQLAQASAHTHVHTLSKPRNRHFILANREQGALVRRYKRFAWVGFSGFFLGGSVVTLMASSRWLA